MAGTGETIQVRTEITATVWQVLAHPGSRVAQGDDLVILESMKMEIPVMAPCDGTVAEVRVAPHDTVTEGDIIIMLEP